MRYIWESPRWTDLFWNGGKLLAPLGKVRRLQGEFMAEAKRLGLTEREEALIDEAMATSAIEGEKLDRDSVRSSVARRLGLSDAGHGSRRSNP